MATASASTSEQRPEQGPLGPDPEVMEAVNRGNVVVFLDMAIGDDDADKLGRIKLELFSQTAPKTAENFRQMCTGEYMRNGQPTGYKNCSFHRIMRDFMIQGGDILEGDGTGDPINIYGNDRGFADETFQHKHDQPGVLSMANSGPNTNGCQFFIVTSAKGAGWLDNKHVVFGRVLDSSSMLTVRKCEAVPVVGSANRPRYRIRITECGEL